MTVTADVLIDSQFDWDAALFLALCSELVYLDKADVEKDGKEKFGFETCEFDESGGTQFFIAKKGKNVVIAVRGTEERADWRHNFRIRGSSDVAVGRVHRGFLEAFNLVRSKITQKLATLGDGLKIWVTGHSLGGAIGTVLRVELDATRGSQFEACYTFGQPKVGNRTFTHFIDSRPGSGFYRFVNDGDVITRIPPGFRHVGELVHIDGNGTVIASPEMEIMASGLEGLEDGFSTEEDELSEADFEAFLAEGTESDQIADGDGEALEAFFPSFSDHRISRYIDAIGRLIPTDDETEEDEGI